MMPATDIEEPNLTMLLTEHEDPIWAKSRILMALPNRANDRSDSELDKMT
jgi:hypothetical protein